MSEAAVTQNAATSQILSPLGTIEKLMANNDNICKWAVYSRGSSIELCFG